MIQFFSYSQLALLSIVGFICYVLLQFIVLPYSKIRSFRRHDSTTYFFPVLGQYKVWKNNLKKHGDVLASVKQAGYINTDKKIFVTNIGKKVVVALRDPLYIKEFLQNHYLYNKDGPVNFLRPLLGKGLLLAEGDVWKHHRKIISNSFHYESLKKNIEVVQRTTKEFLGNVKREEMKNYPLITKIQEITGEVVGRVFFGEQFHRYQMNGKPLTLVLADLIANLIQASITPLGLIFGPKLLESPFLPQLKKMNKQVQEFRNICIKMVEDRRAQNQVGNDLLSSLIASQKSDSVEERMTDEEIIDEFMTFFAAGMDTTGHLIGMAIYMLTQHPQYIERLRQERNEIYPKGEEKVTAEDLQRMDQLHNFLKETLRLYSPAPMTFTRAAVKDHTIIDLDIKKGTWVKPDLFALFNSDKNFEEPQQFNPDRWNNSQKKLDSYAFIPFAAGPRNCIGQHLALIEAKVIICEFLERFDMKLKDGYDFKMILRFMYEPANEIFLELSERGRQN